MSYCGIYQSVNGGKRVVVFWACLVKVNEVYTHPPLGIGFFDKDNIGNTS